MVSFPLLHRAGHNDFVASMLNVALLTMKPRLRDILSTAIGGQDGLALVDWHPDRLAINDKAPDVFVQEVPDVADPTLPTELLRGPMHGRVLLVRETGSDAAIYELRLERGYIANVAIDQLIDAIRLGIAGVDPVRRAH
jgi:hypothetical protein